MTPPPARAQRAPLAKRLADRPQAWWPVGLVVLAGQFVWLLLQSLDLYRRFSLTSDFALFYQAAHQIAAGHLYPTGTIYRTAPFFTNHFELILYPLSLLVLVDRGGGIAPRLANQPGIRTLHVGPPDHAELAIFAERAAQAGDGEQRRGPLAHWRGRHDGPL